MSKDINLTSIKPQLKRVYQKISKHAAFTAIFLVLLIYLFLVWKISGLTAAGPTPEAEGTAIAETNIPKIDKKAIQQIQQLEENSPELQALFNEARNNPFLE